MSGFRLSLEEYHRRYHREHPQVEAAEAERDWPDADVYLPVEGSYPEGWMTYDEH